jgi:hypothetical protein
MDRVIAATHTAQNMIWKIGCLAAEIPPVEGKGLEDGI